MKVAPRPKSRQCVSLMGLRNMQLSLRNSAKLDESVVTETDCLSLRPVAESDCLFLKPITKTHCLFRRLVTETHCLFF